MGEQGGWRTNRIIHQAEAITRSVGHVFILRSEAFFQGKEEGAEKQWLRKRKQVLKKILEEPVLRTVWRTCREEWTGEWDGVGHVKEGGQREPLLSSVRWRGRGPCDGMESRPQAEAMVAARSVCEL